MILTTPVDITADSSGRRRSVAVQPTILFHAENARDRLGKSLDINVEVQTGDITFDDAVYVESRSPADDVQAVLAEPSVRTSIQTLIAAGTLKLDAPGLQLVLFNYTRLDRGRFEQLADALVTMAAWRCRVSLPAPSRRGRPPMATCFPWRWRCCRWSACASRSPRVRT